MTRTATLPILKYHNLVRDGLLAGLSKDEVLEGFRLFIKRLSKRYDICTVSEALNRCQNGDRRAIAISFDDGYQSYLKDIAPILVDMDAQASFYVCTGLSSDKQLMWNDQILVSCLHNKQLTPTLAKDFLSRYQIEFKQTSSHQPEFLKALERAIKYRPFKQRAGLIQSFQQQFGLSDDTRTLELRSAIELLNTDEIRALHQLGMEVGGHTVSHPILAQESAEDAHQQIISDQQRLAKILGRSPRSFAYPNGWHNRDFLDLHKGFVEEAGYEHAVSANYGISKLDGRDQFMLKRIELPTSISAFHLTKFYLKHWLS
ncbi:polysaccharide deacetylase family protein [Echinimonas agarilytica]|uniref:Polysaccharide deacetylase family protein n=1 Tax=Echinimonas agarilytica TaxID=1215918 RepID=A0AA42B9L6_9GAMM|nr:polysaccharide deacetylase family protein [Echinimonas agarilytica]MCM2681502.1 polysaccharide deacetylase family protein [Echinimonas agarilytica]